MRRGFLHKVTTTGFGPPAVLKAVFLGGICPVLLRTRMNIRTLLINRYYKGTGGEKQPFLIDKQRKWSQYNAKE